MKTFLVDLHVHTIASPDGRSTQRELAKAAKAAGLHAIAVTDHNLCTPLEGTGEDLLLIPGCEISTSSGHITGLFLQRPIDLEALGKLPAPEKAVEAIRAAGGLAVLAHPYQKPGAAPENFTFPLDGLETANARACFKVKDANEKACALAERRKLPAVGGSDAHDKAEVGNAYTELTAEALTPDSLREALATGRSRAVLKKNTAHFRKGLSQWTKAKKAGGPKALLRGIAYLGYCAVLDLCKR